MGGGRMRRFSMNLPVSKMMERIDANKTYYLVLLFYAGITGAFAQNLINPMVSMIESYGWKVLGALGIG